MFSCFLFPLWIPTGRSLCQFRAGRMKDKNNRAVLEDNLRFQAGMMYSVREVLRRTAAQ